MKALEKIELGECPECGRYLSRKLHPSNPKKEIVSCSNPNCDYGHESLLGGVII